MCHCCRCCCQFAPCWQTQTRMTLWCLILPTCTRLTEPSTRVLPVLGPRNMPWTELGDDILYCSIGESCLGMSVGIYTYIVLLLWFYNNPNLGNFFGFKGLYHISISFIFAFWFIALEIPILTTIISNHSFLT